jgi:hypothetical protein
MKCLRFIVCLIIVLLMAAVPVTGTATTISGDSITSVSPQSGQKGETAQSVTITGVNFTGTTGSVRLEMSGESDIDASITKWGVSQITCKFNLKSKKVGEWDVVVVKGYDDTEIVKTDGFAITEALSISSISPDSGQSGDEVDITITGKDFDEDLIDEVFLSTGSNVVDINADDFDVTSSTKIKSTFDLDDADADTYDICIEDKYGAIVCKKNAFEVITNAQGTIDISTNPSGATIYIDDITNGTTPRNIDILVGSHKVTLKKAGYQDWGKIVNVKEDETVEVDATLYAMGTATPTTAPANTPYQTSTPRTTRTTVKSTIKVPTTWAEVPTTAESPVEPALIIGAVGLAFIALRKH